MLLSPQRSTCHNSPWFLIPQNELRSPSYLHHPWTFLALSNYIFQILFLELFGSSNFPYEGPKDETRINQGCQQSDKQEHRGLLSWRPCRPCWNPWPHKQTQELFPMPQLGQSQIAPGGISPQSSCQGLFSFSKKCQHVDCSVKSVVFNIN